MSRAVREGEEGDLCSCEHDTAKHGTSGIGRCLVKGCDCIANSLAVRFAVRVEPSFQFTHIPTTVPHEMTPHCCGCLTGRLEGAMVIFECNECGDEVGRGIPERREGGRSAVMKNPENLKPNITIQQLENEVKRLRSELLVALGFVLDTPRPSHLDIVFDGPPGPVCGRFVEVEDNAGRSVTFGNWLQRSDGYWVLRLPGKVSA